ncbi:MAG: asparagine synthase (glutamine-hydrolyzing) [Candidatus Binatia bacterium]
MCGIYGAVFFERALPPALLPRMGRLLAHRGPDEQGAFVSGTVGLGHQRLSIIDLSARGRQPLANEDGTVHIVCNGELYGYAELRERSIARGHRYRSGSDSEVILHLYEDSPRGFLSGLNGMFALAIWDENRRTLLLARDRLGKKPLYYVHDERVGLVFASELKALLAVDGLRREVDEAAIDHFLTVGFVPAPLTGFKGIRKLPAGHVLRLDVGRRTMSVEPYWTVPESEVEWRPVTVVADELRALVEDAVRLRLVADVPVGLFLSGGLDSSTIAVCARKFGALRSYTVAFDDRDADESATARATAATYGLEHREFRCEPQILETLPTLVWHADVPFGDPAALPLYHLSRLARSEVKVVLTGEGGDELFGGYWNRYRTILLHGLWGKLPAAMRGTAAVVARALGGARSAKGAKLLDFLAADPGWRLHLASAYGTYARIVDGLYAPDFRRGDATDRFDEISDALAALAPRANGNPAGMAMTLDLLTQLPEKFLLKTDTTTMAHGLEARCPFLDVRVAEFACRLPDRFKVTFGDNKRILKAAFGGELPAGVARKPKRGFHVPIRRWLAGPLRQLVRDTVLDGRAISRGYFRAREVQRTLARAETDQAAALVAWRLLNLELWHRTFIDPALPSGPIAA